MLLPNVIIPSAGDGTRVQDLAFSKPKPLISICGKPVITWITDELLLQGLNNVIYVVPNDISNDNLVVYINDIYKDIFKPSFVRQKRKLGPLHAVNVALPSVQSRGVLLILSDTICFHNYLDIGFDYSWVLASSVKDYERWCLVELDKNGFASCFHDKSDKRPTTDLALIGVYYFHDIIEFQRATQYVIKKECTWKGEFQMSTAIEEYMKKHSVKVIKTDKWQDVGTIDNMRLATNFLMAKKSRVFNKLDVDICAGTITKSAERGFGERVLRDEVKYYENLPPKCIKYFPRLFNYENSCKDVYLSIEYWPLDILADTFLYCRYSEFLWDDVLNSLVKMLDHFKTSKISITINEDTKKILWNKTLSRINKLKKLNFSLATIEKVMVNNKYLYGWPILKNKIKSIVDQISLCSSASAVHGDLCFSNILCDIKSGLVKCIDPRGRFGNNVGIIGDQRYDIAKLRQSYHGHYDFIINRLYKLKENKKRKEYQFDIFSRPYHYNISKKFDNYLISNRKFNLNEIKIIEGLLFVSMCPLHYEDEDRQKALWIRGLQILNNCIKN